MGRKNEKEYGLSYFIANIILIIISGWLLVQAWGWMISEYQENVKKAEGTKHEKVYRR